MNRLPVRFEEEVLKNHNIEWDDVDDCYIQYKLGVYDVSKYQVLIIALGHILKMNYNFRYQYSHI